MSKGLIRAFHSQNHNKLSKSCRVDPAFEKYSDIDHLITIIRELYVLYWSLMYHKHKWRSLAKKYWKQFINLWSEKYIGFWSFILKDLWWKICLETNLYLSSKKKSIATSCYIFLHLFLALNMCRKKKIPPKWQIKLLFI